MSKQQPSTEIYNITIEGGEDRLEYAEGEEAKTIDFRLVFAGFWHLGVLLGAEDA